MANQRKTKITPQAKKSPAKKSPSKKSGAKKSPAQVKTPAKKSRVMSAQEVRLKNKQASINKVISDNMKVIADLNAKHGTDLDKFIKVKGQTKKRKVKTIINEALNKVTKARKEQAETTIERQIVSKGAYKPKTTNKPVQIAEKTPAKKGVRTIGTYHPWERTEYVKDIFSSSHFGVDVTDVDGVDISTDIEELLNQSDKGISSLESGDVLILKIDTKTGRMFTEKSTNVYGSNEEEEEG